LYAIAVGDALREGREWSGVAFLITNKPRYLDIVGVAKKRSVERCAVTE
jgi:hypothetical protein